MFRNHIFCCLKCNSSADMLLSNRRENICMGHFKEIEIACIIGSGIPRHWKNFNYQYISKSTTSIVEICWTEPPFRANLLFGYAQSGLGQTSFSGSTLNTYIYILMYDNIIWYNIIWYSMILYIYNNIYTYDSII